MPAQLYNITIEQKATFELAITWTEDDGAPINLTGYTAKFSVRTGYDGDEILSVTDTPTSDGGITLGGADGTIQVELKPEYTALLPSSTERYVYDLVLKSGGGKVYRLINGTAFISPGVTNP